MGTKIGSKYGKTRGKLKNYPPRGPAVRLTDRAVSPGGLGCGFPRWYILIDVCSRSIGFT